MGGLALTNGLAATLPRFVSIGHMAISQRSTPHRRQQGGERRVLGRSRLGFAPPSLLQTGDARAADGCRAEVPK
jgi:hypothetical protein